MTLHFHFEDYVLSSNIADLVEAWLCDFCILGRFERKPKVLKQGETNRVKENNNAYVLMSNLLFSQKNKPNYWTSQKSLLAKMVVNLTFGGKNCKTYTT